MLALYLLLAQAPEAEDLLGAKPEASDRQLTRIAIDGCYFGPPPELTNLIAAAMREALYAPRCKQRAERRGEDASGTLSVRLSVSPAGTVNGVEYASEDMEAPTLEACLTRRLEKITVTANPMRGDVIVRMPTRW